MKKSEIKIGHIYSNGKGRLRKVIDIGPQYKRSSTTEARRTEPPESNTT